MQNKFRDNNGKSTLVVSEGHSSERGDNHKLMVLVDWGSMLDLGITSRNRRQASSATSADSICCYLHEY